MKTNNKLEQIKADYKRNTFFLIQNGVKIIETKVLSNKEKKGFVQKILRKIFK